MLIIGDSHGKYNRYLDICSNHEYTIQVGDLGYSYQPLELLDSSKHKFLTGNHESHNICYDLPHCLGRFGYTELNGFSFFFVSGAFSIDKELRIARYEQGIWPKTWFENEELSKKEMAQCKKLYEKIKPDILITHEAPRCTVKDFTNSEILKNFGFDPKTFTTKTSDFLDTLWEIHKPYIHVCGHYHKRFNARYGRTEFLVLEELGTVEL